ncbi:(2E,6E)-farnesyl diphosphate synthase [Marinobacter sp. S0848L]|uniref:(2E,6E)-farnesyl diphosphate synthase n=1 Tax=Marinobacter sp. S0848L TaxID=2926423 RepID=UPI001FF63612|nr:farnesyl diphosphate synthase [Marinobacter sp. S0848L]MCK0106166.1 (2E,6E)-farnesyl diphosphate synthase [Marinobacter sp. S0848L]
MTDRTALAIDYIEQCRQRIDAELDRSIRQDSASERLQETMRYSVLGGGKRIRPALCLAAARAVGSDEETALVPACALELIHAYSLVHDDLPAMDDDDLRRGRPTAHIAFDEASAILAGDALQALAFSLLASAPELTDTQRIAMITKLAQASGHAGMVGGQAIDLESVGIKLNLDQLETMHRHKTGALIEASVDLGASTSATVSQEQREALANYARTLGLAFQVQDDLLDIEGDTAIIGKRQGSDAAKAKPTYPALLGLDGAREHLAALLSQAHRALDSFGAEAEPLRAMADYVVTRNH